VKDLFSYVSFFASFVYCVPLLLGLFVPQSRYATLGAILALPLVPVFIRATVRFSRSSRTTLVQAEFGLLFVILTAVLIQLTGFIDSPIYPLVYLDASILALVVRPLLGLPLLALLATIDLVPRFIVGDHAIELHPVLMNESILLMFFGFFLLYARVELRRQQQVSRRLRRFEEDLIGVSNRVFDRDEGISREGIGKEAARALSGIDDLLYDLLDRTRRVVGVDSVVYLVPAGNDLLRVREAASSDDRVDFDARMNLEMYRNVMSGRQPLLLTRGQGSRGLETGYYRKKPFGAASLAIVPVMDGAAASGLLVCDSDRDSGISAKDIQFLELVAVMLRDIGRLIIHFRRLSVDLTEYEELYGVSRDLAQAKRIEQVFEIVYSFCGRMIPVTTMVFTVSKQSDSAIVSIHGEGLRSVTKRTFSHADSLVGWVIANRKYLVFPEKERKRNVFGRQIELAGNGSLALFPLLWEERVIGTCCMVVSSEIPPSLFHVRLIEVVLNMAVVSLTGIRLTMQLKRQAVTDPLTGLYNRRSFSKALRRMAEHADRYNEPVSLLMIDIDKFKSVNDTHGHAAGDDVIKAVADTILSCIRKVDMAARIGGEEFAVILPKSVTKSTLATAERIRKAIKKRIITSGRRDISVTVSIGAATRGKGDGPPDALVKEADRCLYAAKEGGRDRCVSS
jgi:diguanylate cyclase (GGDEF)-like protein